MQLELILIDTSNTRTVSTTKPAPTSRSMNPGRVLARRCQRHLGVPPSELVDELVGAGVLTALPEPRRSR
jgi:hypothetical protein